MDLLEDLQMSQKFYTVLNCNFVIIYTIHKILVLLKNQLNYLKIITQLKKKSYRLKKENKAIKNKVIGQIRNLFRLKKENKEIKNRVIRCIRNLFEPKEEINYYKSVRAGNFWSNNYIEYKSNRDRDKTQSVEEYLNKIRPKLKDIINNCEKYN